MTVAVIDRSRQTRAEHDRAVLTALARAGEVGLPVAELAAAASIADSTVRRRVADLATRGLVVRSSERGPVRITAEGRIAAGPLDVAAGMAARLGVVFGLLPAEAYRAMVRLMLAGVVARHHLRREYPGGWPSFIAAGDTGDAKTALARIVCRAFGLEERRHIRDVRLVTAKELLGRRVQAPGGTWTVERGPLTGWPFVCLDEADKAEGEIQRAVRTLMQGDTTAELEAGALVEVAPVVYATLNVDPDGGYSALTAAVPPAYLGRCVTLDTRQLAPLLGDVDLAVGQLLRPGVIPRLDLAALTPPARELSHELYRWLRDALKANHAGPGQPPLYLLSERGRRLVRPEFLARLPLGLATLYPPHMPAAARLEIATVQVLLDYLCVASTLDGHVNPHWPAIAMQHRAWLADRFAGDEQTAALLPDLHAAYAEQEQRREAARVRRTVRRAQDDQLTLARGELVEQLRQARLSVDGRKVPAEWRSKAGGLRHVLAQLGADAGNAKTAQALADVADRAAPHLAAVAQLLRQVEQDQTAATAALAEQRTQRRQALVDQRQAARQARAAQVAAEQNHRAQQRYARTRAAAALDEVVTAAKQLEQLYRRTSTKPDENPLRRLHAVRPGGHQLLTYTPPRPAPAAATIRQRVTRWAEGGSQGRWTSTVDSSITFPGTAERCSALAQWGSGTRAVLVPVLAQLHAAEDQLRAHLGRAGRRRPDLTPAVPARLALPR